MASVGTLWAPVALRFLRVAVANTTKVVRTRIANTAKTLQSNIPQSVKAGYTGRQPIHPTALLRQQRRSARWFSSATGQNIQNAVKRFISTEAGAVQRSRFDRSAPSIARHIAQASGRAPFSGALRPNLTGGALPRSAGGYGIGGSARYFSHTPAAPAQVVQNVSQAMRAFFLSGQKLQYEGLGPRGERQYRAVSCLEDKAMAKFASVPLSAPGAFIDFNLKPTVTAMGPLAAAIAAEASEAQPRGAVTLNGEGFLDGLSADFDRALKDINAVQADIRRLSILGDLPVLLQKDDTVRVRFPGVDAYTVERLCDDIGIQRGVIGQDPDFDDGVDVAMALRFPFAPQSDKTLTSPGGSARSIGSYEFEEISSLGEDPFVQDALMDEMADNPWFSESEMDGSTGLSRAPPGQSSQDYEGLEGIYRFLEECDRAKNKYH